MDYRNDINEIEAFINEAMTDECADYRECLSRFTRSIDEEFLQERANAIKQKIIDDTELQATFRRLATNCNENRECNPAL